MKWLQRYQERIVSAEDAVGVIRSGDRVYVGGGCAMPHSLVKALVQRSDELEDVEITHILTIGEAPYADPKHEKSFRVRNFFIGGNLRKAVQDGRADYVPIFLAEIPRLFLSGDLPIDVALISVSPPDEHGFCSFGIEVGCTMPAAKSAKIIIAEINDQMPRCHGDSFIHINKINYCLPISTPLSQLSQGQPSNLQKKIGQNVAELIEDGSTLQLGIGGIPDGVLFYLEDKKDLGIHSEMFSDGIIGLVEKGIVNNERKTLHPGKIIAGFVLGTQKVYDFMDDNPIIEMHPTHYTNDPFIVSKNDKMVAINSAIEVDLTGQVCADSIGTKHYSGIGGQIDFIRGAARSKGGKPIIALPSTARNDSLSRIVPMLKPGAGVVTSRGDVHYVVTEWGVASLYGKSIRDRVYALAKIAHPKFREELIAFAKEHHYI
ncbi:MAG: 4-hydroxybutyrate CoA-transferase [Candidatus Cloacimonetes bacterium 4572_55]|nr:MAG: 4-hydroxybutyrate CoA-transferase [Candidatus Cloacimonetes bacterium 4572_55]